MPLSPDFRKKYEALKKMRRTLLNIASHAFFFLSLLAFLSMLYDVGFRYEPQTKAAIHHFNSFLLVVFFIALLNRFLVIVVWRARGQGRKVEVLVLVFFVLTLGLRFFLRGERFAGIPWIHFFNTAAYTYLVFLYVFVVEISRRSFKIYHSRFSPAVFFIYSFLLLIFGGAGLLLLPKATYAGISAIDALFTATSAVCVTGLVVVDTATYFTPFGQRLIMLLIQLGGLGIMTFTSFFALLFQKNSSFQNQLFMQNIVNEERLGETFRTIIKIVALTLGIEALGALCIFFTLDPATFKGVFSDQVNFSVFHAISAFCNAGFSLFSDGLYDTRIRFNYHLQLIVAILVIVGGLGFPIMFNLYKYLLNRAENTFYRFFHKHRYRYTPRLLQLNTKIVLATSGFLLLAGTVLFSLTEYYYALQDHSTFYGKLVTAFFGSVTPRTAGFNTVNMATLAPATILFYLLFMWIGASPASTGGGIKTSTFAVAFLNIISIGKGRERLEIMKREVPNESVRRAFAVVFLSIMVIGLNIFLIMILDPQLAPLSVAFEVFSAFGTVGLSLNLTPLFSTSSKIILIITMFLGRVGIITFILGFFSQVKSKSYRYPAENIIIS